MARAVKTLVFSHWYHFFEGFQASSQDFYGQLEEAIVRRTIPQTADLRIFCKEGGLFSGKREYLRVQRYELALDVCGARFGNGFFVSWWLGEMPPGCLLSMLLWIPPIWFIFHFFIKPMTYYRIDTALMFQQSVHSAVMEVLDSMTTAKGVKALTEDERKPIMKDFFK